MIVDVHTVGYLWPEMMLVVFAVWLYLGGTIRPGRALWLGCSLAAYAAAAYVVVVQEGASLHPLVEAPIASGPIVVDYLGYVSRCLALFMGAVLTLVAGRSPRDEQASEYFGTLMLLVVGMMLVARANELVFLFVSLELISVPTYVLLLLGRRDRGTSEAAVKYFYLSVFSSALLLYGLSFVYGITGTTALSGLAGLGRVGQASVVSLAPLGSQGGTLAYLALVLVLAGLGFKIAAVPFHFYAPDVYQGTTNANAGLLAVAPKVAGMLAIVRLLVVGFPQAATSAWQILLVLAIMTMTLGNVCALWQGNIRRLLAYSSVAHAGYMLIGLTVAFAASERALASEGGLAATLFYLFVYALAALGAFAALTYLSGEQHQVDNVDELAGLGRSRPVAAAALAVCLFSLAGVPPLAGFWGKLMLFLGAIQTASGAAAAHTSRWFAALAVIGAVNAAIAAAYYLRVVAAMYFRPATKPVSPRGGWGAWIAMCICAVLLIAVGFFPKVPLEAARSSERSSTSAVTCVGPAAARSSPGAAPPLTVRASELLVATPRGE